MNKLKMSVLGILLVLCYGSSLAGPIYSYQGPNFTTINGSTFSTTDAVSGFVEFLTAPVVGEIGKSDVASFSFTTGPTTITSLTPASFSIFSFDFDGLLNITNWQVVVEADVLGGLAPEQISTWVSFPGLISPLDFGNVDDGLPNEANAFLTDSGLVNAVGVWTQTVPEPTALALFGIGIAGLGWSKRKKA